MGVRDFDPWPYVSMTPGHPAVVHDQFLVPETSVGHVCLFVSPAKDLWQFWVRGSYPLVQGSTLSGNSACSETKGLFVLGLVLLPKDQASCLALD